jgi:hypothetical protein
MEQNNQPGRHERRGLERRADRLLARLRGRPIRGVYSGDPRRHAILLGEHTVPLIVHRESLRGPSLAEIGLEAPTLDDALEAIERADDGARVPVLILIDGWMQIAWVSANIVNLSRGGDA